MNSPSYVLRVSVKVLGKKPVNGLETKQTISVGQVTVTVKQRERFLILLARDFASEAEAEAFLPRMKNGLWNVAIEHNVAFVLRAPHDYAPSRPSKGGAQSSEVIRAASRRTN